MFHRVPCNTSINLMNMLFYEQMINNISVQLTNFLTTLVELMSRVFFKIVCPVGLFTVAMLCCKKMIPCNRICFDGLDCALLKSSLPSTTSASSSISLIHCQLLFLLRYYRVDSERCPKFIHCSAGR